MRNYHIIGMALFLIVSSILAQDQPLLKDKSGWVLSGGQGSWQIDSETGDQCLTVHGSGKKGDSNYWRFNYPFEPNTVYKVSCKVRTSPGALGNNILIGSNLVNRDVWVQKNWVTKEYIFVTPEKTSGAYLKFGQWHVKGTVWFKDMEVHPVQPVYAVQENYKLGAGERIQNSVYSAMGNFKGYESNFSRYLQKHNTYFNTNRWDMYRGNYIIFCHQIGAGRRNQQQGTVTINVGAYYNGECLVEAGNDGINWVSVGAIRKQEQRTFELPQDIFPAEKVFIRCQVTGLIARLQIHNYEYQSGLSASAPNFSGHTQFFNIMEKNKNVVVRFESMGSKTTDTPQAAVVQLQNPTSLVQTYDVNLDADGKIARRTVTVLPGKSAKVEIPIEKDTKASSLRKLSVKPRGDAGDPFEAQAEIEVPYLEQEDYGSLLYSSKNIGLWWTDAVRKIGRNRGLPKASKSNAITLTAARNEYEAAQLVLRSEQALDNVHVRASDLRDKKDNVIPANYIKIMRVDYVPVKISSDPSGMPALWPDPLPELENAISLTPGQNQPLWILVKVPSGAIAGDYEGEIFLQNENWETTVQLKLHVWNFTLPAEAHLKTSFGFAPDLVRLYHHLKNESQTRLVIDKYYQNFSEHRISPYNPFFGASVKKTVDKNTLSVHLDFSRFDSIANRNLNKYHFNTFRMNIDGLGSGTFHARKAGSIAGFNETNPQYKILMTDYLKDLQNHYENMGWLDKAYIYWFDEPEPNDYDFVKEKMRLIHEAAPKLTRMLTEQPEPELYGAVDIWCANTQHYDHEIAEQRRKHGERFWWYVCSAPTEPFCTLFIDHYAVELRTWLWQTWKYDVKGILVWQSVYWHSNAAYPDELQNPYKDPMSYVSGYSLQKGEVKYWGNGDGRFLYPPKIVFENDEPCLKGPVNSIRWEMLRDGIEDYEYLWMLRNLLETARERGLNSSKIIKYENLLEVPSQITASMTEFSLSPEPIYEHREKVAQAIEWLRRELVNR